MTTQSEDTENLTISIVLVPLVGGDALIARLESIKDIDAECIIVSRQPLPEIVDTYPNFTVIESEQPVPIRRKLGVQKASGDIAVLLEDTTAIASESLSKGVFDAFQQKEVVAASGPVSIGQNISVHFQALGCTEYGRYHAKQVFSDSGVDSVEVQRLPGNFICYRRQSILDLLEQTQDGLIEGAINEQLLANGGKLLMSRALANEYCEEDQWGGQLMTRYHHGFIYAGQIADNKGFVGRLIQACKSMLLPMVLSLRAIGYLEKMEEVQKPMEVSMRICFLEFYWAMGEVSGSLKGSPKNMDHWR